MGDGRLIKKVTSVQVVKKAGISQPAVRPVFTPRAYVSQATIDKEKKVASDLGCHSNVLARAMVSGKSKISDVVVAYLVNQFYPKVLESLSKSVQA